MPPTSRRRFGAVRRLTSGRWQARYPDPARPGVLIARPQTFRTKTEAAHFLAGIETDQARGAWLDPSRGAVRLATYADAWLATRTVAGRPLAPRTRANYRGLLGRHVYPSLGALPLAEITPERVRLWHAGVSKASATTAAQAYRVLHAILRTATDEGTFAANPCRLRGAGQARAAERPLLGVDDVEALAAAMPVHLRALVQLGFWGALRLGELIALEQRDLALDAAAGTGSVRVERAQQDVDGVPLVGPPKAESVRTVNLPTPAVAALVEHLATRPVGLPTARVFTRASGRPLRHYDVHRQWSRARLVAGVPDARPHDLRHAGLTLAAQAGATLAEVMRRAGHSSPAAALRYQHAAEDRDRDLAGRLASAAEQRRTLRMARSWHAEVVDLPASGPPNA